ncbi:MAG TPA: M6 family metalloprotease domain-containing protein [Kribbellaceae bacterium]
MSAIFGETLTFTQDDGEAVKLVVFGDDFYSRYETPDGFTVVYDDALGGYCYAEVKAGRFTSTGRRLHETPPEGLDRHLHEELQARNSAVLDKTAAMLPEETPQTREAMLTFGSSGGLLPGRRLDSGAVRGLTILVTFPDLDTAVKPDDVDALLNSPSYRENGNACSVNEYFKIMSTNRLDYTNDVVGPFRLSRPRLAYANTEGLLVPEALALAEQNGVDFSRYDSLGEGIVDSVCIMYAGRTEYRGDLWPHNWVHRATFDGVRTELYIVTSMGRVTADLSIGTFCHESGHLLCRWPDLYDYGVIEREGDDFQSAGLGSYCVMGAGNHLDRGRTPAPVSMYLRNLVGWCGDVVDLSAGGNFSAKHGDYDTALQYPTNHENEYFLVENRSKQGFDAALPASGLAVYHCDTRGSNEFQQGTREQHYQCALLQADGHLDLEHNLNQGDGGDLYGGIAGTALSHSSRPASLKWDGSESGLTISAISDPGPVITFAVGAVTTPGGQTVSGASNPGLSIPDNRPTGVTDTIMLSGAGTVRAIKLAVDITHTYVGDLRVVLLSPTGRRTVLHNRTGRSADDLHLRLDSEPPSVLAPMIGQPVAGAWALRITDAARVDVGTLDHWSIEITTGT